MIDLIAKDLPDLLQQLDGREVNGRRLATAGAAIVEIPMTVREKVFQIIAHPQVMLILMLVVMYGVIGELTSPGAILPGVAGVIALVLLLYLASVLPMNVAGLALVGVADRAVRHRRVRADPRRADGRRHHRLLPGHLHALRPQRALPAAVPGVDPAGHGRDGRCSSSSSSVPGSAPSGCRRGPAPRR